MENKDPYLWKQAKERVGFKMHLRSYVIVNIGLWLIWAFTTGFRYGFDFNGAGFPWPLFASLGWGIGLASHYFSVYMRQDERSMIEREYEKLRK